MTTDAHDNGAYVKHDPSGLPCYQEPGCGPIFVWLCDLCGQPLAAETDVCRSGIHCGPGCVSIVPDGEQVGRAVKSIDVIANAR